MEIVKTFKMISRQSRSTVDKKHVRDSIKPVIFTTQYKPPGPNINSIIRKHLPTTCHFLRLATKNYFQNKLSSQRHYTIYILRTALNVVKKTY